MENKLQFDFDKMQLKLKDLESKLLDCKKDHKSLLIKNYGDNILKNLSEKFLNEDFKKTLDFTMDLIGNFLQRDEVSFFSFEDFYFVKNSQWSKENLKEKQKILEIPLLNSFKVSLFENQIVEIDNTESIDDPSLKFTVLEREMKSLLLIPIKFEQKLLGVLKVENFQQVTPWQEWEVQFSTLISRFISSAYIIKTLKSDKDLAIYKLAIEASDEAIWDLNLSNGIMNFSENYFKMLGYEKNEMKNSINTLLNLVHSSDREKVLTYLSKGFGSSSKSKDLKFRMKTKSLDYKWIFAKGKVIERDERDLPKRIVGIQIDIDSIEKIHEENRKITASLEEANRIKEEFLTRVNHELNTPLNAIIGIGNIVSQTPLNEKQQEYINKISQASLNLKKMINKILDYTFLEKNALEVKQISFNFKKMIENLAKEIKEKANQKSLYFDVDYSTQIPNLLIGDPQRIYQILQILCDNAVKFTKDGSVKLELRTIDDSEDSTIIQFLVKDTGIGIKEENKDKIFRMFYQEESGIARNYEGLGVSLSFAKKLTDFLNADLSFESEENKGSIFKFSIPLKKSSSSKFGISPTKDFLKNKSMLFIYKPSSTTESIKNQLQEFHFDIKEEFSIQDAIKNTKLKNNLPEASPIQIILTDSSLLSETPLEIIGQFNDYFSKHLNIPILLLDSSSSYNEVNQNYIHMDGIVKFPSSDSSLFNSIWEIIHSFTSEKPDEFEEALKLKQDDFKLGSYNILLVEDSEINLLIYREILKEMGLRVDVAHDAFEGIERIDTIKDLDLIITDIQMPRMNGFEFVDILRNQKNISLPIISLSAETSDSFIEECLKSGINHSLKKPLSKEEAFYALKPFLDNIPKKSSIEETKENKEVIDGLNLDVSKLNGIDYKNALRRLNNNHALFEKVLKNFYDEYKNFEETLNIFLNNQASFEEIKIYIHTLKGISGSIDALNLYNICKKVEDSLHDSRALKQMSTAFKLEMSYVLDGIKESFKEFTQDIQDFHQEDDSKPELSVEDFLKLKENLKSELVRSNPQKALEKINVFREYSLTKELKKTLREIEKAVQNYEFSTALSQLDEFF